MGTMSSAEDPVIARLLSFWFDHDEGLKRYFMPNPDIDRQCESDYGTYVTKARNNELDSWKTTKEGSLALIILLDQFPRNIFRGSGHSFSSDAQGVEVATNSIALGFDREVRLEQQLFFYLPFMHAQSMVCQVASLGLFQGYVARAAGTELAENAAVALQMSQKHMDVVRRFGRFPARNKAMGLESTAQEAAFLRESPSGL